MNFANAKDIHNAQKISFDICSSDAGMKCISIEIKPLSFQWMHETFFITLTDKPQSVE